MQILRLFDEATLAPRRSHKAADTSACFHGVLPALLAAAAAPDRAVRAAALDALQALSASVKAGSSHAEGTLTGMPSCRHSESAMALLQMSGGRHAECLAWVDTSSVSLVSRDVTTEGG